MSEDVEAQRSLVKPDPHSILGINVHPFTVEELHEWMSGVIDNGERALVLNVNVNTMNYAYREPWLQDVLNEAPVVFCDGAGIMLGARLLGYHIPQRITYADWTWELAAFAEARRYSLYFLGARPGVAEKAALRLQERFPRLQIAGIQHGYFDKRPGHPENEQVIAAINAAAPDFLMMGLGQPLQEKWLAENWQRLNANIGLAGGAVFDYVAGELQRAPSWMTDNGLEWLGRLLIEPKRLWRRYVFGNPQFLWRVLKQRAGATRD